jgi:hypothetical protein
MLFLADRGRYTQRTLLHDVHDRLTEQPGCESVRYDPSRRRPRYVIADVETAAFLGGRHGVDRARLEIRFWYPADVDREYYRINWIEPTRDLMVGFHRDADHPDLGPCHRQLDHEGTSVERTSARFLDTHPLAVLDERLQQLPATLASIEWRDGGPTFSE